MIKSLPFIPATIKSYRAPTEGQSLARRLGLFAAFTFGLAVFNFPYWPWVALYAFLLSFFMAGNLPALSRLNILFWLASGSLISVTRPETEMHMVWPVESYGGYLLAIAGFAAVYAGLFYIHRFNPRLRAPVIWLCLTFVGLLALIQFIPEGGARLVVVGVLFAMSKTFWMTAYQLSETDFIKDKPFLEHFGTLSAPWQATWVNTSVIRGYSDYSNQMVEGGRELWLTRVSGVKLLGAALLWKALANLWSEFFFSDSPYLLTPGVKKYAEIFGAPYLPNVPRNRLESWAYVITYVLYFSFLFTAYNHALVGIVRYCGFMIMRAVYKPYLSTSFTNFLSRYYFYYVAILQRFFFYPLWAQLRFIGNKKLRMFAAFFLTILFAGYITSFERHVVDAVNLDLGSFFIITLQRLPYFISLAVVAGLAAILPGPPGQKESTLKRVIMSAFYFLMYAVCFYTQLGPAEATQAERWQSLFFLFGLN